ncbi:MAG: fibronectin type III domain-containing protein [Acidobacteria bacterium]|nr:fibronectin type III domain-containing protein [Acidobacteriota bacterium]
MRLSLRTCLAGMIACAVGVALALPVGATSDRPSAPRNVHAVPAVGSATVSWGAPSSTGGSPLTKYVVTSTPGKRSCTAKKSPCRVTGLKVKTSYHFTVVAFNKNGAGVVSAASNKVTPLAASKSPTLTVTPSTGLSNGASVKVSGTGFTPHDSVFILECLANATGQSGCNIQGFPTSVKISASGVLPVTVFKVATGRIGTGTCGTTAANAAACAISVGNASGGDTASRVIKFKS